MADATRSFPRAGAPRTACDAGSRHPSRHVVPNWGSSRSRWNEPETGPRCNARRQPPRRAWPGAVSPPPTNGIRRSRHASADRDPLRDDNYAPGDETVNFSSIQGLHAVPLGRPPEHEPEGASGGVTGTRAVTSLTRRVPPPPTAVQLRLRDRIDGRVQVAGGHRRVLVKPGRV